MGFKSVFKKGIGSGMSPSKWVGYDHIKSNSKTIGKIFRGVFKNPKKTAKKESFEEAVKRYDLTEEDIQQKMKKSKELSLIFLGFGILLIAYTLFQWFGGGRFVSGFICLILSLLTFVYSFKESFNLFQMRERRLGCTYKEWFKSMVKGSK